MPPTVLVIDDDLSVLEVLEEMLSIPGYEVVTTNDGNEALKLIEGKEFHLVLTDLRMPEVDGWEIAQQAKAKNPLLPVILLSAWVDDSAGTDFSERYIDLFLPKPFDLDNLLMNAEKLMQG